MIEYEIVDTRVCLDASRSTSVRLNVTVNASKNHAIQWLWNTTRITDFSGSREQVLKINRLATELVSGDKEMLDDMNNFTEPYTV